MLSTLHWFFIALVLVGALATVAITAPDKVSWKVLALGLTTLFLPVSYLAANDLLSRPKPMQQELLQSQLDKAVVLSSLIKNEEGIFIWLKLEGIDEPRAYRLPWNEQMAVELHRAQSKAEQMGLEMTMELPEGQTLDQSAPVFQVSAPPALPPKVVE